MRATFLLLLLANLAFFAWAALIDVAPEPPQSDSISHLPRLQLLSEVRARQPAAARVSAPANAASVATSNASAVKSTASNGGAPSDAGAASGANGANSASAAPNDASTASATRVPAANGDPPASAPITASADRCVTIGPFSDPQRMSEATALLQQRGFTPRPRLEASQNQGYWVYIGGLTSQSAEASAVRRLERNGVTDAKIMPTSDEHGRRVSVGLFKRRDDAERRARAVRHLGLDVQIEQQQPQEAAHWVDVSLASSPQALPTESLLSLAEGGSRLEIAACPTDIQPSASDDRSTETGSTSEKAGSLAAPSTPTSRPVISKPLAAQSSPQPD